MANKSERRIKARRQKRAAKEARMKIQGTKSKYAKKKREQAAGKFRSTSPFYLSCGNVVDDETWLALKAANQAHLAHRSVSKKG